ncbi:MAG TPA: aspartate aminotransferase family protein [Devosiaceae bacterium]|nr:aspartate aminotransferase family protein [Devosiaceae bacterium]
MAELRERAGRRIPGGVNSNVRLDAPNIFFERGAGPRIYDTDGRDYIDYLLGQGPAFLGHAHPEVVSFVAQALTTGQVYAAQHPLEIEAAEGICSALGWPDMVRLNMTGTEAVQAAFRLARAVTGRKRIIRFEGQYHGWLDNVLIKFEPGPAQVASAGQLPEALDSTIVVRWNDLEALREALATHGHEVAAVITEPMMLNQGAIEPKPGYLEGMKKLVAEAGALLIFDEVITGFRLALGGAAERFGVAPDLAIYGKAIAGGFPVSAIAGKAEYMERFGTGEVNHSGTFNACVMAAAAVVASMRVLQSDPPYERVAAFGEELMAGMREIAKEADVPLRVAGPGMAFHASFLKDGSPADLDITDLRVLKTLDLERYRTFAHALASAGIWVASRGIWYVSAAHGRKELDETLSRFRQAIGNA